MATAKAESFDVETFGKTVALFDSNNAGEAENAFRKAVLLCAKNGLRFCDAAAMAFGQGDGGEVAALQEQLQRERAENASRVTEAAAEVQRLRAEVAELRAALEDRERRVWHFLRSPKPFLLAVWALVAVLLLAGPEIDHGLLFYVYFAAVACAGVLLEHWAIAQWRVGLWLFVVKSVVLLWPLRVFTWYMALSQRNYYDMRPVMVPALIGFSLPMLLLVSPFCEWLAAGMSAFVRHPVLTVRGWFL